MTDTTADTMPPLSDAAPQSDASNAERDARFREFVVALEPARAHFRESGRQLLLGLSATADATSGLLDSLHEIPGNRNIASGVILLRSLLDLVIARIPALDPSQLGTSDTVRAAKLEALFNLRAVLQAEHERLQVQGGDASGLSVIEAILAAIGAEIERAASPEPATTPDPSATRYEVAIGDDHG